MMTSNERRTVAAAAGGAPVLPDEMVTEVLLLLPVKSILRFRAVSRSWAALLSSDEFCGLHMAKAEAGPAPPKLLFVSPTPRFDATAAHSCSPLGRGAERLCMFDDVRGDFMQLAHAPCRGLTLLYDAVSSSPAPCL